MKSLTLLALASAAALPASPTTAPAIAGRWTQASTGKELVLVPKIKLVPNVGVTAGTSLGGSVGYGSMTRTTIVTEPVTMAVNRSMTLNVAANGSFDWTIVKRHDEKQGCTIATTQVKRGRVTQAGTKLHFAVAGGTESYTTSCGRRGAAQIAAVTEIYELQQMGSRLVLTGGASRWTFTRG